jgi:hypothetical protein
MHDLCIFILSVLKQLVSYMSGPVSLVLYVWARKKGREIPLKWYIRIVVLFLFIGCFASWSGMHTELVNE